MRNRRAISIFLLMTCVASCSKSVFQGVYYSKNANVLYAGISQYLFIGKKMDIGLKVETDKGIITHIKENEYEIYPDTIAGKLNLTVRRGKREEKFQFRIKSITNINFYVATKPCCHSSRIMTAEEFKSSDGFVVPFLNNFDEACRIAVEHFKVTRIVKTGWVETRICSGNKSELILKAEQGDIYLFEDISVSISQLEEKDRKYCRKLNDVVYYIK